MKHIGQITPRQTQSKALSASIAVAEMTPTEVRERLDVALTEKAPEVKKWFGAIAIYDENNNAVSTRPPRGMPPADQLSAAAKMLDHACRPAPPDEILKALTKVRLKTSHRTETGLDEKAILQIYVEELMSYPADCVMHVLKKAHTLDNGWFPSCDKLNKEIEFFAKTRMTMKGAINK